MNLAQHRGCQNWPNNEGLRRATGQCIAYLGHDDLWFPWHLASLVSTLEEKAADFVHAATINVGPAGPVALAGEPWSRRSYAHRYIPPCSWLHRRELVETCGEWPDPEGQVCAVNLLFQRRAFLAGKRFAASGQLTVVKFPSTWWRPYGRKIGHPQENFVKKLERNPVELHQQLLTELAFAIVRNRENQTGFGTLTAAAATFKSQITDWYGWDRWPLAPYLKWKTARRREEVFKLRGLTADDRSADDRSAADRPIDDRPADAISAHVSARTDTDARPAESLLARAAHNSD
jgi:hypothetical protein